MAVESARLRRVTPRAEPLVWLCSGAVVLSLGLLLALLGFLSVRGFAHFWPQPILMLHSAEAGGSVHLGVLIDREQDGDGVALLVHRGGEDYFDSALVWVEESSLIDRSRPADAVVIERRTRGLVYGFAEAVGRDGVWQPRGGPSGSAAQAGGESSDAIGVDARGLLESLMRPSPDGQLDLRLRLVTGEAVVIPGEEIEAMYAPNAMSVPQKAAFFLAAAAAFVSDVPRQGNVEGGVFPAILGTVTLVMLMTVVVAPLGVLAAVYLREYARSGPATRLVRIAVNNLAGVPSIVFGVFALGFFVYGLGGSLDQLFFSDRLPAPTVGAPGLLWAALTMALLTLPVVVVTTEEGLARVPRSLREGSFALGATRAETLWRVILPAASPAVLTGLILAVARATGEVAPLLLVGVAKYSPGLPVDGDFPYLHLDRQFMHLGFYIYDVGFQSPDPTTSEGIVFATALLLVSIVLLLNIAAVILRGRLREAFRPEEGL
ncbi:MAG: phosphate ABC transporter permease PstA [Halieaceae bacterium]|jgi:phosphate transport system permease protein|nr:phosphate ABC transporter permease PstA [Halieaceae bacterium]